MAPLIVGCDPLQIEPIWTLLYSQFRDQGQRGLTLTAQSGIDIALWDIAGKRFGNRLLVEYGYGLVDKLGTLLLRYQLSDRFMLESRTGTVSNLDIVYSVKKK